MNSGSPEPSTGPFCVVFRADSESCRKIGLRAPPRARKIPNYLFLNSGAGKGGNFPWALQRWPLDEF
eukprot:304698-Alexandrium_andersonii.AAC.1